MATTASTKAAAKAIRPRRRPTLSKAHQEILDTAKRRFKIGNEADTPQRSRELDDLAFYAGGLNQWTKDQQDARKGQAMTSQLPPLPARPCITINKVRQPVQQVTNQIRQSDFGIEIAAADDFGGLVASTDAMKQEIEVREGLTRRIQRQSEASDARLWAAIRAAIAGRGYYAVLTRFLPGKSWDREIYVHRFYNQASILLDPAHEMPDGSDATWAFIGVDLPIDDYEAQYGTEDELSDLTDGEFRALGDDLTNWFTYDKQSKARTVRVVDYLYLVYEPRVLVQLADGTALWKDEAPEDAEITDERDVVQRRVKWAKLNGLRVLEEPEWESGDLPIVKVLGEELQPFDAERRAEGMVRPARDAQVGFNVMVSKWVETVGLTPIPPLVLDPESIEGYEKWYQLASTRTLPFLPRRTRDDQGREFAEPHSPQVGRPDVIQAMAASVQMFDEAIQSTTGVPDSRVGKNTDSHLKAARAIEELKSQSEQGTSNYADNLRRSVRREGEIINGLLYPIYGKKPGRLVKIIDGQGHPQDVLIGQKPGMTQQPPQKVYTLTEEATFNINIKVTKDPGTRREEESTFIAHLLDANPMFMTWFGDLFFENQDGPGHAAMAERAKVMLDPKIAQMMAAKDAGTTLPPEIAQQLAQKDQQIQHAEAAMQELAGQVKAKQIENDTKVKIAQMDNDTKREIAAADREVKLGVAELGAKVDRLELFMQESQLVGARTHEAALAAADAGHDEHMATLGHQQAVSQAQQQQGGQAVLADQGHQQGLEAGDAAHQQALEQQQQAAAPEPAAEGA